MTTEFLATTSGRTTYHLRVKHTDGALVRVLGLTRRRRYDVTHLVARPSADGDFLDLQMTVHSQRSDLVLARQLEKLLDVTQVHIVPVEESDYISRAAS
jgi:acetolactate synthase regulatory subunit